MNRLIREEKTYNKYKLFLKKDDKNAIEKSMSNNFKLDAYIMRNEKCSSHNIIISYQRVKQGVKCSNQLSNGNYFDFVLPIG